LRTKGSRVAIAGYWGSGAQNAPAGREGKWMVGVGDVSISLNGRTAAVTLALLPLEGEGNAARTPSFGARENTS